ncbi:hypothetical protein N7448_001418 [Penicillium atrosanguineum]|uniref:Uncharacterized protein n=1 Tax=Penicillium atrosanguineum TaxID=1132637 RepID=A0A9W9HK31_9EURO|nr:hypothetical protein N7448_001418 [Penicillium atrosanguineum]KAJ5324620.1 hypothetical protein N7476_003220 [Penicillium atrosanguineum]
MSAHVVVIDATARRATVKTTPTKHLTDVLQEACSKLGYNPNQYALKHNGKQLDLSLSYRLSGLIPGAKLELVQLSRSPSVVTVALQLPESEARGAPNGRILDKFPSSTTLWLVLRKFEAGVAGAGPLRNLTARGVPATTDGDSGAGSLFYEIPVLRILERELSSFADLQKTLAQLGFNSGNVLMRLSFRQTEDPLHVAMTKIAEYFKASEDEMPAPTPNEAPATPGEETNNGTQQQLSGSDQAEASSEPTVASVDDQDTLMPDASEHPTLMSTPERPIAVFSPPSANTPSSAQIPYNEEDYVPSVEHAKAHQRLLNQSSRNQRLLTDAEIAAKAAAEEKRRSAIREVDVKVRFPDQSQIVAKFGPFDSGKSLYGFVRNCLDSAFSGEKFNLNIFSGPTASHPGSPSTLPESDQTLIQDLGLAGRVLVNFTWADGVSSAQRRTNLLRPELRSKAQELKVEQPLEPKEEPSARKTEEGPSGSGDGKPGGAKKSGGIPKWLKLPGKK